MNNFKNSFLSTYQYQIGEKEFFFVEFLATTSATEKHPAYKLYRIKKNNTEKITHIIEKYT